MTPRPKLIKKDSLVIDALNIMNKNKITFLIIINNNNSKSPLGIIHIHDCLRYVN